MLGRMDATGVIDVAGLHRHYSGGGRGFEAVRGVSFSVRRGELFALLGTNGAGKTSLLEVVEGLACASSGTVRVLGCDPHSERRAVRPRVGIVLQDSGFPPELTVMEMARMWAGTLTAPRPVGEALELVDLGHRARVGVRQLSGGERRRLDLALAVLGRPEVLFLDEPTSGLDPAARQGVWRLLRDLLDGGATMLLSTHHMEEAESLADRLAIMHRGRVVRTGTPAEVVGGQAARISFGWPPGVVPPLPVLPGGVTIQRTRGVVVLRTRDLQLTVAALLEWANHHDLRLHQFTARAASLQETFLALAESGGDHHDEEWVG
jgi:ABC-2 type transport system ATP-binding protein